MSSVDPKELCVIAPSGEWGQWEATRVVKGVVVAGPQRLAAAAVKQHARVLVLDDCDAYLTGVESEFWRRLLSTNRHLGLDVILITRRPQELPRWSIAAATRLYVLRLGPRETAWCERTFGVSPPSDPSKPHAARAISL